MGPCFHSSLYTNNNIITTMTQNFQTRLLNSLLPHLYHLPVRIRVQSRNKRRTSSRAVLGVESSGPVPDPTSIAKCFRAHWALPPLWGFGYFTMCTFLDPHKFCFFKRSFCFHDDRIFRWFLPLFVFVWKYYDWGR
ncbi:hypothetical protein Hanom_Chr07g00656941 [Helianthus anomalus]